MAQIRFNILTVSLLAFLTHLVFAKQRISVTAPMQSVEEGGVLAVHCRVWNLHPSEEVTIVRKTREALNQERLSFNGGLVPGAGEQFFLATRQLDDASNVYFLSLMDVSRQDEGEYICYIMSSQGGITEIASGSVFVSVFYFPSDTYPFCKGYDNAPVMEGSVLKLNCSSELANPPVTLTWSRAGTDFKFNTFEEVHNGIMYSTMTLRAKLKDNGSVFLCSISSTVFPGDSRQCHLGPLNVISTDGSDREPGNDIMGNAKGSIPTVSTASVTKYTRDINMDHMHEKCKTKCSTLSSSSFFWIICTVISIILAFFFGIIGVILIIRFYRKTRTTRTQYMAARRVQDDIYSELDNRRTNNKFYMTLVKPEIPKSLMLQDRHGQFDMKLTTHPLNA